MDVFNSLWLGLGVAMQPMNLLFCFAGVFIGTLIGVGYIMMLAATPAVAGGTVRCLSYERRRRDAISPPRPSTAAAPGEGIVTTHPRNSPLNVPSPTMVVPSEEMSRVYWRFQPVRSMPSVGR
jgi:hypothetical protein